MLRKWNVTLVDATFLLSILGTFITRSGVIESVHAFAQSSVGNWFLGFLIAATIAHGSTRVHAPAGHGGEGRAGEHGEPRGGIPVQQSRARRYRVHHAVGHAVPDPVGVGAGREDHGRHAVLQLGERAARPVAAGAHRHRPAHRVAPCVVGQSQRQFIMPVAMGFAAVAVLMALGMRHFYALVFYGLRGFVLGTITQEFVKGISARRRMYSEGLATAAHATGGAQSPPLWRLHRALRRGRDVRRVRRSVLQEGLCAGGAQEGDTYSAVDPWGHTWTFRSEGLSRYKTVNRDVTAISLIVDRDGEPMPPMIRRNVASTSTTLVSELRAVHGSRDSGDGGTGRVRLLLGHARRRIRRHSHDQLQSARDGGYGSVESSWPLVA